MRTRATTPADIENRWYVVDANGVSLGRIAAKVAIMLQGKNKPYYTPNLDTGDNVIVINVDKAVLTGNKENSKVYFRHSGYRGGQTETTYIKMIENKPVFPFENAVKGMLPKTKMGRQMIKKLFVYTGDKHPHVAQKPEKIEL